MSPTIALEHVLENINYLWMSLAILTAFLLGALWYSLFFFKMWVRVFRLDNHAMAAPLSMVRSFIIQCVTGSVYGFLIFVLDGFATWLAWTGVLAIAGWQMCALTFKYKKSKDFLQAVLIESGYTLAAGTIYVLLAQL